MKLPLDFTRLMQNVLDKEFESFSKALDEPVPTSVRINSAKCKTIPSVLKRVEWCDNAFYLNQRIPFTFDPYFHSGYYYVQEASSMFVGYIINSFVKESVKVLDLCAAPGGKTTLALASLPKGSLVVANEYVSQRSQILAENVIKWGYSNSIVTNNTPADYGKLRHTFDIVIVDAPCSGEGMFRKDDDALAQWSLDNVNACVERQKGILSDVWEALRPGGMLIYSTCTYNTYENEDIANFIIENFDAEPVGVIETPASWGISKAFKGEVPFYRFMPHKTSGEGFTVTVLRKSNGNYSPAKAGKSKLKTIALPNNLRTFLRDCSNFEYTLFKDKIIAFSPECREMMQLMDRFNILHAGIQIAVTDKGKDFIPHHCLSQSVELNMEQCQKIEVDYKGAISYLRREAIPLEYQQRGMALVTYKGAPLGWAKCVGNRANNLYPQEWRIRNEHTADTFSFSFVE